MINRYFVRVGYIAFIYQLLKRRYPKVVSHSVLPISIFDHPMNLIPMVEFENWLLSLPMVTGDPHALFHTLQHADLSHYGVIGHWFFSGNDLSSTIRRINSGYHCLQSGAFFSGSQQGSICKWSYDNYSISAKAKAADSIRMIMFMIKVYRFCTGQKKTPLRVLLSCSKHNEAELKTYFGCEIIWDQDKTELWFHSNMRLMTHSQGVTNQRRMTMSFYDLDGYLNMPDPQDELKVFYQVVEFSCHFGYPTLAKVAQLLGLSEQQCQRRLQRFDVNFSTILGYVLSNLAVELIKQRIPIAQITQRLGYQHEASFNRMFKKYRGITARKYIDTMLEC